MGREIFRTTTINKKKRPNIKFDWILGNKPDLWTEALARSKKDLDPCMICGDKTDGKEIKINGHKVFQNLRVKLPCTANNPYQNEDHPGEHQEFCATHPDNKECTVTMHVGCAMWGIDNDEDEHSSWRNAVTLAVCLEGAPPSWR